MIRLMLLACAGLLFAGPAVAKKKKKASASTAALAKKVKALETSNAELKKRLVALEKVLRVSGGNVTLRAKKKLTLTAGTELSAEASTKAKLKGGAGVEVSAAATLDLKGSITKINGGGLPAARLTSVVNCPSGGAPCTVVQGSPSLLVP